MLFELVRIYTWSIRVKGLSRHKAIHLWKTTHVIQAAKYIAHLKRNNCLWRPRESCHHWWCPSPYSNRFGGCVCIPGYPGMRCSWLTRVALRALRKHPPHISRWLMGLFLSYYVQSMNCFHGSKLVLSLVTYQGLASDANASGLRLFLGDEL